MQMQDKYEKRWSDITWSQPQSPLKQKIKQNKLTN